MHNGIGVNGLLVNKDVNREEQYVLHLNHHVLRKSP